MIVKTIHELTLEHFDGKINTLLREGWMLQGHFWIEKSGGCSNYYQMMFKPTEIA